MSVLVVRRPGYERRTPSFEAGFVDRPATLTAATITGS
jgi:hypothetical protein